MICHVYAEVLRQILRVKRTPHPLIPSSGSSDRCNDLQLVDCHIILPHTPHATVMRATSQVSVADFNDLPPEVVDKKFGSAVKEEGGGISS
jgi:hypothetical protein